MSAPDVVHNHSRIPKSLQAVFVAANQGQDVHEPPKDGAASRTFVVSKKNRRRWPLFRNRNNEKEPSEQRGGKTLLRWFARPKRRQTQQPPSSARCELTRKPAPGGGKLEIDHTEESSSSETCREEDPVDHRVRTEQSDPQHPQHSQDTPLQPVVEEPNVEVKAHPLKPTNESPVETAAASIQQEASCARNANNRAQPAPPPAKSPISSRGFYNACTPPRRADATKASPKSSNKEGELQPASLPPQPDTPLSSRCFYGPTSPPAVVARNDHDDDGTISSDDWSSDEESSIPDEIQFSNETRGAVQKRQSRETPDKVSPQVFLDTLLRARGYSTERFSSLQSGYSNKPTDLQQASYGTHLVHCIRSSNANAVREMMQAGLSPNACNAYGESILHLVCRCGDWQMLFLLLSFGASVQTVDDFGRSCLHDVCWAPYPSFATVELILQQDVRLLYVTDSRQTTPLSYVCQEHWPAWRDFLRENADKYWPIRNANRDGREPLPLRILQKADSCPVSDPPHALPARVAAMVAQGRLKPCEADLLVDDGDEEEETETISSKSIDTDESDEEESDAEDESGGFVSPCEDAESIDDYASCGSQELDEVEGEGSVGATEDEIRLIMTMLSRKRVS